MALSISPSWGVTLALTVLVFPCLVQCFGAGDIESLANAEGLNYHHGDIEDVLLTLFITQLSGGRKFTKVDLRRVYFGNWLRDYSQALDFNTLKHVNAEAIRIIVWVLSFMSFGLGANEFEVTRERLGVYRPEEHIDNPRYYADNADARGVDSRLRGPVDEPRELVVDLRTGLKMYIASEDQGITTSAAFVRNVLGRCIYLGRRYNDTHDKADFREALRLLGTGCHCLEDYPAHSNYCELALHEMGAQNVFPCVGPRTAVRLPGVNYTVFPVVTGTFGSVDFLQSVLGEVSEKLNMSELSELEATIATADGAANREYLHKLLDQLPAETFSAEDKAYADKLEERFTADQLDNLHLSPTADVTDEALTEKLQKVAKQIEPIMQFHDKVIKTVQKAITRVPILPALVEQIQAQVRIFAFSLLAPLVLPVIKQVKEQLMKDSSAVIAHSKDKEELVFKEDFCLDPTHSVLSKDHFSNVLNEPAGKLARSIVAWVVPQVVACWDDNRIDVNRQLNRIVAGVYHHPALRLFGDDGARDCHLNMFQVMERWWMSKSEQERGVLSERLNRDAVRAGRNHDTGVVGSGQGCGSIGPPKANSYPNQQQSTNSETPHNQADSNSSGAPGAMAAAATGLAGGALAAAAHQASQGQIPGGQQQHFDPPPGPPPGHNSLSGPPPGPPNSSYPQHPLPPQGQYGGPGTPGSYGLPPPQQQFNQAPVYGQGSQPSHPPGQPAYGQYGPPGAPSFSPRPPMGPGPYAQQPPYNSPSFPPPLQNQPPGPFGPGNAEINQHQQRPSFSAQGPVNTPQSGSHSAGPIAGLTGLISGAALQHGFQNQQSNPNAHQQEHQNRRDSDSESSAVSEDSDEDRRARKRREKERRKQEKQQRKQQQHQQSHGHNNNNNNSLHQPHHGFDYADPEIDLDQPRPHHTGIAAGAAGAAVGAAGAAILPHLVSHGNESTHEHGGSENGKTGQPHHHHHHDSQGRPDVDRYDYNPQHAGSGTPSRRPSHAGSAVGPGAHMPAYRFDPYDDERDEEEELEAEEAEERERRHRARRQSELAPHEYQHHHQYQHQQQQQHPRHRLSSSSAGGHTVLTEPHRYSYTEPDGRYEQEHEYGHGSRPASSHAHPHSRPHSYASASRYEDDEWDDEHDRHRYRYGDAHDRYDRYDRYGSGYDGYYDRYGQYGGAYEDDGYPHRRY